MEPQVAVALIRDAMEAASLLLGLGVVVGIGAGIWRLYRGPREIADADTRRPHFMQGLSPDRPHLGEGPRRRVAPVSPHGRANKAPLSPSAYHRLKNGGGR